MGGEWGVGDLWKKGGLKGREAVMRGLDWAAYFYWDLLLAVVFLALSPRNPHFERAEHTACISPWI